MESIAQWYSYHLLCPVAECKSILSIYIAKPLDHLEDAFSAVTILNVAYPMQHIRRLHSICHWLPTTTDSSGNISDSLLQKYVIINPLHIFEIVTGSPSAMISASGRALWLMCLTSFRSDSVNNNNYHNTEFNRYLLSFLESPESHLGLMRVIFH